MRDRVLRPLDWAFPSRPVKRELLHQGPGVRSERPPILFVHGAGCGAWMWAERWMPALASRGWDTWAVSLRGHGESGERDRRHEHTLRDHAHDVLQALTHLPARPVLVGHSYGALAVAEAASRYTPKAVVLLAPAGGAGHLQVFGEHLRARPLDALGALVGRSLPWSRTVLVADATPLDVSDRVLARMLPMTARQQYAITLPRTLGPFSAPTLVAGGRLDRAVPPSAVARVASQVGAGPVVWLEGAGHLPMVEPAWQSSLDALEAAIVERLGGR